MKLRLKRIMFLFFGSTIVAGTSLIAACTNNSNEHNERVIKKNNNYNDIEFISAMNLHSSSSQDDNSNTNFLSNNFLNKIKNKNYVNLIPNNVVISEDHFNFPVAIVFKQMHGETFLINNLPKNIEVLNSQNESSWFNVEWDQTSDFKLTKDTIISGSINNGFTNIKVNAYIFVQSKAFNLFTDYKNRDLGMTIDLDKTTKDGNPDNIAKLIDRNGDYVSSGSRWDNWGAYDRPQDNNIVFKWEKPVNISRISLNFWKSASRGASAGRLPKNIFIQYSQDGESWTNVSNQDKISSDDLGSMNTHSHRLSNISETKTINFDNIKTNWIRFNWEPAKDDQQRNLIIGITNMQFFGKDNIEDALIKNKIKKIIKIKYEDRVFNFNDDNNEYVFNVDNFTDNIKYMTHSSVVEQHLVSVNEKQRVYKIISYNDEGEKTIYKVTFKKSEGAVNEN